MISKYNTKEADRRLSEDLAKSKVGLESQLSTIPRLPKDVAATLKDRMVDREDLDAIYVEHKQHDQRLFDVLKSGDDPDDDLEGKCQRLTQEHLETIKGSNFQKDLQDFMKKLRHINKSGGLVENVWKYVLGRQIHKVDAVEVEKGTADWFIQFIVEQCG